MQMNKGILAKSLIDEYENALTHLAGALKGAVSPCSLCIGCEVEDNKIGICDSFISKVPGLIRIADATAAGHATYGQEKACDGMVS